MGIKNISNIPGELLVAANQHPREREFWSKSLSGELTKSIFPYDYRPKRIENEEEFEIPRQSVAFEFSADQGVGLMKLSTASDVKLHIVLAAALTALLEKYTPNNQSDIIIGTPIYKQEKEGEYINTVLPLRNLITVGMSFKELLLQTRQTIVEAVENQSYPIEILVKELDMEYTPTDFPLFDVAFLLENIQDKKDIWHIPVSLLFSFNRNAQAIAASVDYNPLLYKEATIRRITTHLTQLVRMVLDRIDTSLAAIDILSEEEKKQLLIDFNDTETLYPKEKTIHEWFEEQVERTPEKIAVVGSWQGVAPPANKKAVGKGEKRHVTYRELNEKANQLACELRLRGVVPNTVAAIILEPSIELIIAILAILKAGGAYLPIDHDHPEERTISILNDSGAAMLLTRSGLLDKYSFTALQGIKHARIASYMTPARSPAVFDNIPHPDRSLIDFEKYSHYIGHAMVKHAVSIQATRGCPYQCAFCHRTMEKRNIPRSAENIFEEVKYYYDRGVRRFGFVDEIFNLDAENSMRFYRLILKHKLKVQLFFPNGLRADRLSKDYIDLMVEAGTVNLGLALETASPRLQKLIKKNLDIEKLRENAEYFCAKHPHVILELFTMHGFPTETEEEAMMTLDFLKSLKWVHFPYVFLLKIHPSTDMMQLALEHGISREAIERSMTADFHEIPETLPFPRSFTRQYVAKFMNEYFLNKERLLHVILIQMKVATEKDLVGKYDNYLPAEINSFDDILRQVGITREELGDASLVLDDSPFLPDYNALRKSKYTVPQPKPGALRVLLLDLSVLFSTGKRQILQTIVTEPLGLLYLSTYLRETFKDRVHVKMFKSRIDFDRYEQLKPLVCDFKPHLIGIRTLSFFKDFFHKTASLIREWGITAPIIAGGPYGTSDYQLVLQDPEVALTVLKEGEITLAQLVEKMMANHNRLPSEEVLKTINGIAFIEDKNRVRLKEQNREILCLDKLSDAAARHPFHNLGTTSRPEDLLYLISTSGSTGKPKSVMLEHRNLANLLHFQYANTGIDFTRVLQFASIGFDVSAQEIFSTLLVGGELYLITNNMKSDVQQLLDYIDHYNIEVLFLPPAFVRFIFSEPQYIAAFPRCVRHIITAGEKLIATEPFRKYLQENRVVLHNHYGPAETHVVTAFTMQPTDSIAEEPSIGFPISNTCIYILGENRNPKPVGAVGELYIGGANVGRGYLNKPELTAEKFDHDLWDYQDYHDKKNKSFLGGPGGRFFKKALLAAGGKLYKTGDLARWLPDGILEFIGRVDYQVKIRGFRIEPGEVERTLLKINAVKEAVVLDRTDATGDRYLCAYIVSDGELDTADFRDNLSLSLPDYMIPAYFIKIDKIPLNPNGKIDKRALPMPNVQADVEYIAPEGEIQCQLAAIWSDVLSIEQRAISADHDFFEMGGHSLKATILISRIHKAFNVKITLGEMFEHPTIQGLANYIAAAVKEVHKTIEPAEILPYYPLSSSQKRMYIINQLETESINYNMPSVMKVDGHLEPERFEGAFKKLMERQESLRTQFVTVAGEPVQKIVSMEELDFKIAYKDYQDQPAGTIDRLVKEFVRPFDLGQAPLLRIQIIKTAEIKYFLMMDIHHIIGDGVSVVILINEFTRLYNGDVLPPLRIQYKDYAVWQQKWVESGELKQQEAYWLEHLDGDITPLNLPLDYPRPGMMSFEGRWLNFEIGAELTEKLKKLAEQHDATLYMVLLAAYVVLLHKHTGQETIIVGSAAAGRSHADLENIIGVFLNNLVMKNNLASHITFIQLLQEVRENALRAYENQDYQFEELVEKLNLKRDYSRHPVFDTMLNYQSLDIAREIKLGGLTLSPYKMENTAVKFDLKINATEIHGELHCTLDYSTRLFNPETMESFIENFIDILHKTVEEPGIKISDIQLISEAEKNEMIKDFTAEIEYEF
ncbi:MAG: AMP-binding protein [Candidatus Aminicenantes bacterium]|nr:AMP-binding protein [Candidatus Aminicenantes bacterium]NIM80347.1 AMP-binding protein [Candidatus Aminicenantes bacterium]NIN19678.1 AMP-binding protein [Candidatus Aminicenantes bacterium]NIN43560.1 AMP-binding protein [Candidatus Aminicenantes bacterium]NIN86305.1 AMP-binding protein [Candidatus Aminicenantes bacterium]